MIRKNSRLIWFIYCLGLLIVAIPIWFTWKMAQQSQRETSLFRAIRKNDTAKVVALLDSGVNPNVQEPRLFRSFENFPHNLLNAGTRYYYVTTPLSASLCHLEFPGTAGEYLIFNPRPNPSIIRALLDHGAIANPTGLAAAAPIRYAVFSGNVEVVDLLVKHGASVNRQDVMKLLLMDDALGRTEMMKYLLLHGTDINAQDIEGQTTLFFYVRHIGNVKAIKFLIDNHADVNIKDKHGKTVLFYANHPTIWPIRSKPKQLREIIAILKKASAK